MIILRPVREDDIAALLQLFEHAHLGLTSLPKEKSTLALKIQRSLLSFQKKVTEPTDEYYLFVLEESGSIVGISAIFATTGGGEPLYFFKKEIEEEQLLLTPVSYVRGPSELCSLFLHPDMRKKGVGKLLSFGRLLFVAEHPERFTASFFAELRGVIIDDHSPFWDGLGSHFLHISFVETQERPQAGRRFISHFLPKYPIYVTLLAKDAQEALGKTHPHTEAALKMLLQQGFEITDEVDIFDGGPKLKGIKKNLSTIADSKNRVVHSIQDQVDSTTLYFFANNGLEDFRATLGHCILVDEQVILPTDIAEALRISQGDTIRIYEVHA